MEWAKLDAALAAALDEINGADDRRLTVFIDVEPGAPEEAQRKLAGIGVVGDDSRRPSSATLSPDEVAELSDQPWVLRLSLAATLHLHPRE